MGEESALIRRISTRFSKKSFKFLQIFSVDFQTDLNLFYDMFLFKIFYHHFTSTLRANERIHSNALFADETQLVVAASVVPFHIFIRYQFDAIFSAIQVIWLATAPVGVQNFPLAFWTRYPGEGILTFPCCRMVWNAGTLNKIVTIFSRQ